MRAAAALFVLVALLAGCKSRPPTPAPPAPWTVYPPTPFPPPREVQRAGVTIQGDVRFQVIPWTADLTLAKALLMAEYTGPRDPQSIVIFRGGDAILVETRQLLSGIKNPLLFPGDVVEIRR